MAKTTRKTESTTEEQKPATRRPRAAAPAAGAEKVTTRRRTKPGPGAAGEPAGQGFVPEPTHDEIALRAWSIYERRGGGHGNAAADWFQANTELRRERGLKP